MTNNKVKDSEKSGSSVVRLRQVRLKLGHSPDSEKSLTTNNKVNENDWIGCVFENEYGCYHYLDDKCDCECHQKK